MYYLSLGTPVSTPTLPQTSTPLSVIICAHNEAHQLEKYLPLVLKQNHPAFEVIVVNDRSTDNTAAILRSLQQQFKQLKTIAVTANEKKLAGKKELLAKALHTAINETIVVTDADCFPATHNWLSTLSQHVSIEKKIVLGYSPFTTESTNSLLNKLIRFEATQTAWQYFAKAVKGKAYMGVGRNMLFLKHDYLHWLKNAEHKTAGGDDDLFVNAFGNKKNIAVCLHQDSFVYTKPKNTYLSWLQQKTRHTQASYHYLLNDKLILFGFALAQFGLYAASALLTIFNPHLWMIAIGIVAIFSLIQMMISRNIYNTLRQQDIVLWIPLLQPLYVFSISLIFLLSLIKRSDTWN